ncbi:hypothetical protein M5D96_002068 [Drosophila gunungcola]|uniref:RIIa domain-containing protein n=1 Tax=Drosophila gunungcola TaxID=103775 RepID=A0A9P9YZC5_9MUSC|nr:hypothetical protein M5D96_002068 [Drosophila gunungcola]
MTAASLPRVPEGLRDLMKVYTKEVLREKPADLYGFSANFFNVIVGEKSHQMVRKYEPVQTYETIMKNRVRQQVPLSLVFNIIPEKLTDLIKQFIKAVLKEKPENIYIFAQEYFQRMSKEKSGRIEYSKYSTYEKSLKVKENVAPVSKVTCECGRTLSAKTQDGENTASAYTDTKLAEADQSTFSSSISYLQSVVIIQRNFRRYLKQRNIAREKDKCNSVEYVAAILLIQRQVRGFLAQKRVEKLKNSRDAPKPKAKFNTADYMKAVVVIQRHYRIYLTKKREHNRLKNGPVSLATAAIVIQRAFRRMVALHRAKRSASSAADQGEELNDNASETGSYTSVSTALLSTESTELGIANYEERVHQKIIHEDEEVENNNVDVGLEKEYFAEPIKGAEKSIQQRKSAVSIEIEHVKDILEDSISAQHDANVDLAMDLSDIDLLADESCVKPTIEIDSFKSVLVNHNRDVRGQEESLEEVLKPMSEESSLDIPAQVDEPINDCKEIMAKSTDHTTDNSQIEDESLKPEITSIGESSDLSRVEAERESKIFDDLKANKEDLEIVIQPESCELDTNVENSLNKSDHSLEKLLPDETEMEIKKLSNQETLPRGSESLEIEKISPAEGAEEKVKPNEIDSFKSAKLNNVIATTDINDSVEEILVQATTLLERDISESLKNDSELSDTQTENKAANEEIKTNNANAPPQSIITSIEDVMIADAKVTTEVANISQAEDKQLDNESLPMEYESMHIEHSEQQQSLKPSAEDSDIADKEKDKSEPSEISESFKKVLLTSQEIKLPCETIDSHKNSDEDVENLSQSNDGVMSMIDTAIAVFPDEEALANKILESDSIVEPTINNTREVGNEESLDQTKSEPGLEKKEPDEGHIVALEDGSPNPATKSGISDTLHVEQKDDSTDLIKSSPDAAEDTNTEESKPKRESPSAPNPDVITESLVHEATEEPGEDASRISQKSGWFVGTTRIVPSQGVVEEHRGVETDPDPAVVTRKTELNTSTQVESVETVDRTHGSLESKLTPGISSSNIDESLGSASEKDNAVSSGLAGLTETSEAGLGSVEDPLLLAQSDFGGIVQALDIASTQELVNNFLENEIEYSSRQGAFQPQAVIEEPCVKKSASLVNLLSEGESEPETVSQKADYTDSSVSETTGLDTLSADTIDKATVKLSKPEEVIEKMSQLKDSKSHDRLPSAAPSFDEPVVRPMSSLQEQYSLDIEDGDIIVYNRLQREETRESSAQSDSVVFGEAEAETVQLNEEESGRVHLMRHYTIAGDDPRGLFRSVTIDDALSYVEIGEKDMAINSSNSLCLDDETSENIRKKMMAYSLSETDSDYFDPRKTSTEDFEIDTAMADAMGTSTETESTIVSAATKIQAGARGFLTRRRLRRASAGTKSSTLDTKASFGNDAISESLERFIEEEAAKKIQAAYRMHTRKRKGHSRKMEGISLESNLAARRQKLQRGDALRNDSTPDDENSSSTSGGQAPRSSKIVKSKTVGDSKSKPDMELKWLKMRQNSMPVQIDCEVFRVIPKHMRKRIKSAEANKRK